MLGFWEGTALPDLAHPVIEAAFQSPPSTPAERHALLNGQGVGKVTDPGRIICSCFSVGENAIREAIAGGCGSVTALGRRYGAARTAVRACLSSKQCFRKFRKIPVKLQRGEITLRYGVLT